MEKELLSKLEDLTLCNNCKVSIPHDHYIELEKSLTKFDKDGQSCIKYKGQIKLCLECGEKVWENY